MRHWHSDGKATLVSALSGADNVSGARIHRWSTRARSALAFRKIGALYILIVIIGIFSWWAPSTFPRWATVQQVCNTNSLVALAALSAIVPLSAGLFDISIPYTMTLSGVVLADLVAHSTPLWLAVVVAMLVSLAVGIVNAAVVVGARIQSFIGTLATGSLILACVTLVTGNNTINSGNFEGAFSNIAQWSIGGFTVPVFYALVVAALLWYLLEHTATGRRIYAIGFNLEASRLARLPSNRLSCGALITSSVLAGATGIVIASQLSAGSPTAGTSYLLPAFAAAFLGATQLKEGRFNAWGTIMAVVLLGVGTTGLGLANAPQWSESMFTGVVLISALAVTGIQQRSRGSGSLPGWLSGIFRQSEPENEHAKISEAFNSENEHDKISEAFNSKETGAVRN